jgi:hypothetical protein
MCIGIIIQDNNKAGNTFASISSIEKSSLSSNLDGFLINQYTPYIVVNIQYVNSNSIIYLFWVNIRYISCLTPKNCCRGDFAAL